MEAREKTRLRLTADVMRLLRLRDFRVAFSPLAGHTSKIFVAFPDDTVLAACQRVGDLGGAAHVAIPIDPDNLREGIVLLEMEIAASPPAAPTAEDVCPVNAGSHLVMLVELLRTYRSMTFHVCSNETVAKLIDDGRQPVPA